jgi:hypothetical protein
MKIYTCTFQGGDYVALQDNFSQSNFHLMNSVGSFWMSIGRESLGHLVPIATPEAFGGASGAGLKALLGPEVREVNIRF